MPIPSRFLLKCRFRFFDHKVISSWVVFRLKRHFANKQVLTLFLAFNSYQSQRLCVAAGLFIYLLVTFLQQLQTSMWFIFKLTVRCIKNHSNCFVINSFVQRIVRFNKLFFTIVLRNVQLSKTIRNALAKKHFLYFIFSFTICSFSFRNVCKRFRTKKIVFIWWKIQMLNDLIGKN